ncbi:MAG: DUF368 domain-containing protein [Arachnia sp.]
MILDAFRGALMGMAELVPGVSGGTVALITGVYVRVIDSASHVVTAARKLITGPERWAAAKRELVQVHWGMLIPLIVGMGVALFSMAGVMSPFIQTSPELARGLFLGMVAASVAIPLLMVEPSTGVGWWAKVRLGVLWFAVAALAFWLTGLGGATTVVDPSPWMIVGSAAVAVCALVLPGVSGSFVLLVLGLYEPTVGAASHFDLGYLGLFVLGAIAGLAGFVKGLHWLLHRHHTMTMVVMSGLMLGSLRALWPWQGPQRELLPVGDQAVAVFGLTALGAAVVLALIVVDRVLVRGRVLAEVA